MFEKILIALDVNDEDNARKLIKAADSLLSENPAIHIMTVVPDSGFAIVDSALAANHKNQVRSEAKQALDKIVGTSEFAGRAEMHVVQGTVYDEILKAARAHGVDAIVIGAHRPELKDYLIGPNAARVARHAEQSVFVIR